MGAWGTGLFENDEASDVAAMVQDAKSIKPALEFSEEHEISGKDGQPYLQTDSCYGILVAATVWIAKLGRLPAHLQQELPEELSDRLPKIKKPKRKQIAQIQRGMGFVLDPNRSELYQLWEEADPEDLRQWRERVEALRSAMPQ